MDLEALDLKKIKNKLLEEKLSLEKRLNEQENEESYEETYNPDRSDLAWRYDSNQRQELLEARAKEQLDDVNAALKRLDEGLYGYCSNCGKPIHPERLKVMPTACLCIDCKQSQEVT